MLEKLNLFTDSYFRPYKEDRHFIEKKAKFLSHLEDLYRDLQEEGFEDQMIYHEIMRKVVLREIPIDLKDLSIDRNKTINYKNKYFKNEYIDNIAFVNANYFKCDLINSSIQQNIMSYLTFNKCYFKNVHFNQSTIMQTSFKKNDLKDVNLSGCEISDTSFFGSTLANIQLDHSTLSNTNFDNCYLKKISLKNATLINVQFNSSTLSEINCEGAKMDKITVSFLQGERVDLSEVETF
ncbi:pentapeptide repeat-containing protein [Bacillus swezeyi]|uniref:Pentapeptide repeat-containing protein n=1 Tax=Bacillus swezeyi TaxID=1925020 RepID=A0A5M8S5D0_9BACI|nr:pentapeptide repeat-containing protein [Bacillus swezeyi]KAA6453372.1 pentapeptide repeat-containing protein [Bacillus swezeyi]TYS38744.1 pentapeptide repeat-containing protein [Bacillus swezeyi]